MNRNARFFNVFVFLVGAIFCSETTQACQQGVAPKMTMKEFKNMMVSLRSELLTEETQADMYASYAAGNLTIEEVAAKIERDQKIRKFLYEANQTAKKMSKDIQYLKEGFNVDGQVRSDSVTENL